MEVNSYFVAFIDILGFKEIVESEKKHAYKKGSLAKLYDCHIECNRIFQPRDIDIVQFSDSIVISKKYSADVFPAFIDAVSMYQKLLLKNGFLCRGGIAVNKHYSRSGFIFSQALIDAYKVESEKAIYPRVVVSPDLIELICPKKITHLCYAKNMTAFSLLII